MEPSTTVITLLVDDRPGEGLVAEHGFSVLIEQGERRILFDTGKGGALAPNAAKLGIDLAAVDDVVFSHGHYDHTGGLPSLLTAGGKPQLYFHPGLRGPHYSLGPGGMREIGMPQEALRAFDALPGRRLHPVTSELLLTESVGIVAPIERLTDFEDPGGAFFLDSRGALPDPIEDDLALWIRTDRGIVVVVGCCHAGIVNTLSRVKSSTRETRLRGVVGGLHLLHADERRLNPTLAALNAAAPERLVACHCTGRRAEEALKAAFPGRAVSGRSGMVLSF